MIKKLILAALLFSSMARGEITKHDSIAEMVAFEAAEQIDLIAQNENKADSGTIDDSWYFNVFWLRIRTLVGLNVPLLASFELGPLIEFQFRRKIPENFVNYSKP